MAYIYQIINDINDKVYIGKTERSIQERWREHCRDYLKEGCEIRPLYRAMRKYGLSHFSIELIEETDNPEEREVFWIEQKKSFKYGYNATLGGDGKRYLDYDLIENVFNNTQNVSETARIIGVDTGTVSKVLHSKNISIPPSCMVNQRKLGKIVEQYDLNGNYIQSFPSTKTAAESLGKVTSTSKGATSHISDVCKGKRKTAYGYIWKFAEQ